MNEQEKRDEQRCSKKSAAGWAVGVSCKQTKNAEIESEINSTE